MTGAPLYFDMLLPLFERGLVGRAVHLGYWDPTPPSEEELRSPDSFFRAQDRLTSLLLRMSALAEDQSVLDVGCGFGAAIDGINEHHRAMELVGINIDPRQLAMCASIQPRGGNRISWLGADACHLPFADASFDRVLCLEAIFHFASRRRFLLESARVLKPTGVLVLSDMVPVIPPEAYRSRQALGAIIAAGYGPWPDFWGVDADYVDLARAAGLEILERFDVTENTLPSYRFTLPPKLEVGHETEEPVVRAGRTLHELQTLGWLRYVCLAFRKL